MASSRARSAARSASVVQADIVRPRARTKPAAGTRFHKVRFMLISVNLGLILTGIKAKGGPDAPAGVRSGLLDAFRQRIRTNHSLFLLPAHPATTARQMLKDRCAKERGG